jgi:hypothetical protein
LRALQLRRKAGQADGIRRDDKTLCGNTVFTPVNCCQLGRDGHQLAVCMRGHAAQQAQLQPRDGAAMHFKNCMGTQLQGKPCSQHIPTAGVAQPRAALLRMHAPHGIHAP